MSMDLIFSWLLTYWVHSTIALSGVWLASAVLRNRNLALEEGAWKAAMFLTLVTATLQVGLASTTPFRPLGGALEWVSVEARPAGTVERSEVPAIQESEELASGQAALSADAAVSKQQAGEDRAAGVDSERYAQEDGVTTFPGVETLRNTLDRELLLALWLAVVSLLAIKLLVSYALFAIRLKSRRLVTGGPFFALLAKLRDRAGVMRNVGLSVCRRLAVPLALGYRRWEVCLPTRLTVEFDADEQETVLAHELAHLVRRDALWSLAARALAGFFFFQPLNLIARARLAALSEVRCDDWAVAQTGRPVTLARCLTRVAAWRSSGWTGSPAPAMAGASRSHFGSRVRRLLARGYPLPPARVPRWLKLAVAPAVVLFAAAAPAIVQRSPLEAGPLPGTAVVVAAPAPETAATAQRRVKRPRVAPLPVPKSAFAPKPAPRPVPKPAPKPPASEEVVHRAELVAERPTPASPPEAATGPMPSSAPRPASTPTSAVRPLGIARPVAAAPKAVPPPAVVSVEPAPLASARYAYLTASGEFVGADEGPPQSRNPGTVRQAPDFAALDDGPGSDWDSDDSDDSENSDWEDSDSDSDSEDSDDSDDSDDWGNSDDSDDSDDSDGCDFRERELEDLEDALDAEMEAWEEAFEREFEAMENELEGQMEEFEDQIEEAAELAFEVHEDALEMDVERALTEIEARASDMAFRAVESNRAQRQRDLEREVEKSEAEVERFQVREERRLEALARDLERSVRDVWGPEVERSLERAMALHENAIERQLEAAERGLATAARAMEPSSTDADRARLREEALERARRMAPGEDELARMRAELEGLREHRTPRIEEMDRARAEFERALAAWRASYQADLERLVEERTRRLGETP